MVFIICYNINNYFIGILVLGDSLLCAPSSVQGKIRIITYNSQKTYETKECH